MLFLFAGSLVDFLKTNAGMNLTINILIDMASQVSLLMPVSVFVRAPRSVSFSVPVLLSGSVPVSVSVFVRVCFCTCLCLCPCLCTCVYCCPCLCPSLHLTQLAPPVHPTSLSHHRALCSWSPGSVCCHSDSAHLLKIAQDVAQHHVCRQPRRTDSSLLC